MSKNFDDFDEQNSKSSFVTKVTMWVIIVATISSLIVCAVILNAWQHTSRI